MFPCGQNRKKKGSIKMSECDCIVFHISNGAISVAFHSETSAWLYLFQCVLVPVT